MDEKLERLIKAAELVLFRHAIWVNSSLGKQNPPLEDTEKAYKELQDAINDIKNV